MKFFGICLLIMSGIYSSLSQFIVDRHGNVQLSMGSTNVVRMINTLGVVNSVPNNQLCKTCHLTAYLLDQYTSSGSKNLKRICQGCK